MVGGVYELISPILLLREEEEEEELRSAEEAGVNRESIHKTSLATS